MLSAERGEKDLNGIVKRLYQTTCRSLESTAVYSPKTITKADFQSLSA